MCVKLMHVQGELCDSKYITLKSSIHPKQKGLLHLVRREQLLVFKHAQLQCLVMQYRHCMDMQYKRTHSFHNQPQNQKWKLRVTVTNSRIFHRLVVIVMYCLNLQKNLPFLKITASLKVCNVRCAHTISGQL